VSAGSADEMLPALSIPEPPPFSLSGIAEDDGAEGVRIRTAVLSGLGDVFLAKAGDTILERYQVVAVGAAAGEWRDGPPLNFYIIRSPRLLLTARLCVSHHDSANRWNLASDAAERPFAGCFPQTFPQLLLTPCDDVAGTCPKTEFSCLNSHR
jgi:hypothetical protein